MLSVLDSLIEPDSSSFYSDSLVHYTILECDRDGYAPDKLKFNKSEKSCIQLIATSGDKVCMFRKCLPAAYNFTEKHMCLIIKPLRN